MDTGPVLHAPSTPELAGWKVRRTLLGLVLLATAAASLFLGLMGALTDEVADDGAVMVTIVTIGASLAIGFFGLRYLMLGVKGGGVKFYERAVEADFQKGMGVMPRRRTVPLLHIRVSGSSRLTYAQAITTTGHAFRLPPSLVERSDIYYLGSLGTRPIAPGGRAAREAFERGEIGPYQHPDPDPLPDHGSPWPDPGTLPITVEVPVEPEPGPSPSPPPVAPPPTTPVVTGAPRSARPAPPPVPEVYQVVPRTPSRPEPGMEVLSGRPDVVPPPATPIVRVPPPPSIAPSSVHVPEPPVHRPMDVEGDDGPEGLPDEVPVDGPSPQPPAAPAPPPAAPAPPPAAPPPPPSASDEWELEELPPPEEARKPPSPTRSEWEEM